MTKRNTAYSSDFAEATTKVAFQLTLSRNQIFHLWYVEQCLKGGKWDYRFDLRPPRTRATPDSFIASVRSLAARGLVEHNRELKKSNVGVDQVDWVYRLTPAGRLVLDLLRIAGLVQEEEAANDPAAPPTPAKAARRAPYVPRRKRRAA